MGLVDNVERGLEKLVTSVFRGSGSSGVQPVEIASRLRNQMDRNTLSLSQGRTLAPNVFEVKLGASDYAKARQWGPALAEELCDVAIEHAKSQRYTLQGAVRVSFSKDADARPGDVAVETSIAKDSAPSRPAPPAAPERQPARLQPVLDLGGQRYALNSDSVVLGRSSDADIPVEDPGVSRRHLEIRSERGRAWAVDLGSTNGSYVNGQKVDGREELFDGSVIAMGRTRITFRLLPQRSGGRP
ncbi:FhaA domain-containing protein [Zafaria sp. Z1313]|uniref:DUF3662 and FHA domain-containing protein n=1 Tax=unclassified Zafaria TaxID=2828765 RepID=UPI002E7A17D1|nr:DUF3662 and FHA domain-containing protein [Zafaria sp. J156]MEE1621465.1 DUF3662 and FHA domain-containing protein [Zafaria sp. J156]